MNANSRIYNPVERLQDEVEDLKLQIKSLNCTTGPTGAQGSSLTGPMGQVGPTGAQGLSVTGPMGQVGPTGAQGLSVTGPTGAGFTSILNWGQNKLLTSVSSNTAYANDSVQIQNSNLYVTYTGSFGRIETNELINGTAIGTQRKWYSFNCTGSTSISNLPLIINITHDSKTFYAKGVFIIQNISNNYDTSVNNYEYFGGVSSGIPNYDIIVSNSYHSNSPSGAYCNLDNTYTTPSVLSISTDASLGNDNIQICISLDVIHGSCLSISTQNLNTNTTFNYNY